MTDPASAGDEPAATDLDSIITHALAERGDGDAARHPPFGARHLRHRAVCLLFVA